MGLTRPGFPPAAWTPVRVTWVGGEPVVDWCYTEGESLEDPFFGQSIHRCLRRPFRLLFRHQTPMSTLAELAASGDAVPLAGLVFHCSRCGSTLVSQMLGRLSTTLVMTEPPPIHNVLEAGSAFPVVEWLRWMVTALGQRRR